MHQMLELELLFHRYPDGNECPIANASKTLSPTQCRHSQIQQEELAVIFGKEAPPLPVWTKVHIGYGSKATSSYVQPK